MKIILFYFAGRVKQNFYCEDILNAHIKMEFDASQAYLTLVIFIDFLR